MAVYKYEGTTKAGQFVTGVVEAFDDLDAIGKARQECYIVSRLTQVHEPPSFLKKEVGSGKVKLDAVSLMCSQFASIIGAGLGIVRCVELVAKQTTDKKLTAILAEVQTDVQAGHSLADSFQHKGGKKLPVIFYETVRAGEMAGTLDQSFETLEKYFKKRSQMRSRLASALIYPSFVCVLAVVVVMVMMVAVVPTFKEILDGLDAEMPLMTQVLINASTFVGTYWVVMLAVVAALVVAFLLWKRSSRGAEAWARIKLKLPVVGSISIANNASIFANTMSLLLGCGMPITRTVEVTSKVMPNYAMAQAASLMTRQLEGGRRLADCMRTVPGLPEALIDMAAVGEQSGSLEDTLGLMGEHYDEETDRLMQDAVSKLEPAVLVFVALFAGYIVIALYVAMFSMYSAM